MDLGIRKKGERKRIRKKDEVIKKKKKKSERGVCLFHFLTLCEEYTPGQLPISTLQDYQYGSTRSIVQRLTELLF